MACIQKPNISSIPLYDEWTAEELVEIDKMMSMMIPLIKEVYEIDINNFWKRINECRPSSIAQSDRQWIIHDILAKKIAENLYCLCPDDENKPGFWCTLLAESPLGQDVFNVYKDICRWNGTNSEGDKKWVLRVDPLVTDMPQA